mgnify:CR=1 FL=1
MAASLDFSNDDGLEFPLTEEQVAGLADAVLSHEGVDRECYVSVSVVTDEEIPGDVRGRLEQEDLELVCTPLHP